MAKRIYNRTYELRIYDSANQVDEVVYRMTVENAPKDETTLNAARLCFTEAKGQLVRLMGIVAQKYPRAFKGMWPDNVKPGPEVLFKFLKNYLEHPRYGAEALTWDYSKSDTDPRKETVVATGEMQVTYITRWEDVVEKDDEAFLLEHSMQHLREMAKRILGVELPEDTKLVYIPGVGVGLAGFGEVKVKKRGPGRPKGSKNKPKGLVAA